MDRFGNPRDLRDLKKKQELEKKEAESAQPQWRIKTWFPDLDSEAVNKLKIFHDELLKVNKVLNLVPAKTINACDNLHFADSILASNIIIKSAAVDEIFDLGNGNGFPGIVFAALSPKTKVHIVTIDPKKSEFLRSTITAMGIKNCDVINKTVEALPLKSMKFGISRGFAPIPKAILATRKQFIKGAKYYHMKTEEWVTEVASIPTQLCTFWSPSLIGEYKLPIGEIKYSVVKTDKISE